MSTYVWRVSQVVTGAVLAGMVLAGCSSQPAVPRGSVSSCTQFGIRAIRRHVTVTTVPAACQGLSQEELNVAVGRALRTAAAGARGKVRQRQLIARDSPYLAALIHAVPAPGQPVPGQSVPGQSVPGQSVPGQSVPGQSVPGQSVPGQSVPGQPAVAAPRSGPPSPAALGLAALATWLVTVGLGLSMMARWITRTRRHGAQPGGRGPVLNFTHLGLALTGLLAWIVYLVTGVTGLAWAACGLLLPVTGLGMTLVFLAPSERPAPDPVRTPARASTGTPVGDLTGTPAVGPAGASARAQAAARSPLTSRRSSAFVIAAHITAASLTILLAVLAATGSG